MPRQWDRRSSVGYPRTARVNAVLLQVLGDALERQRDDDERLALLTVTAVSVDADLRHATVFMASLSEGALPALEAQRLELQAAIAREVRLKRTPTLRFVADPAIAAGERVEEALRRVRHDDA
ncbi:MAG: 30S ribosome-binding factor RbfA [Acidimicrobiales bacterium]